MAERRAPRGAMPARDTGTSGPRHAPARRHRRWLSLALALCVLVAGITVTAAATTEARARHRLQRYQHQLRMDGDALRSTRSQAAAIQSSMETVAGYRASLIDPLQSTLDLLTDVQSELATTKLIQETGGTNIATLDTCLTGVRSALGEISKNDDAAAAQDISAAASACLVVDGGGTSSGRGGLVYPYDFPDPFVLTVGDTYYAYSSNSAVGNIQVMQSTDLVHWTVDGNALPTLPGWAEPSETWSPSVLRLGDQFDLYYSAEVNGGPGNGDQCISVATSASPQGPFTDASTAPLVCQTPLSGSIDPSPFLDITGTPYLVWRSNGGNGQPAVLWSQQLSPDGTSTVGALPTQLFEPSQAWEAGVVEAPDLILNSGRYYLFYSGNNWETASYAEGIATCAGPLGPCTKPLSTPILASDPTMAGPGGASVFSDASGHTWLAFAAWLPGQVGYPHSRALFLRPLDLSGPVPVVEPSIG